MKLGVVGVEERGIGRVAGGGEQLAGGVELVDEAPVVVGLLLA